jgi:hypothetical protein
MDGRGLSRARRHEGVAGHHLDQPACSEEARGMKDVRRPSNSVRGLPQSGFCPAVYKGREGQGMHCRRRSGQRLELVCKSAGRGVAPTMECHLESDDSDLDAREWRCDHFVSTRALE